MELGLIELHISVLGMTGFTGYFRMLFRGENQGKLLLRP